MPNQARRFRQKAEECAEEETICESYRRVAEAYEKLADALEERNRTEGKVLLHAHSSPPVIPPDPSRPPPIEESRRRSRSRDAIRPRRRLLTRQGAAAAPDGVGNVPHASATCRAEDCIRLTATCEAMRITIAPSAPRTSLGEVGVRSYWSGEGPFLSRSGQQR